MRKFMKQKIFTLLLLLLSWAATNAQTVYEDFEGGVSDLAWAAPDGTYNGVIANPGADAVNNSAFVGSYTKAAGFGYSLFWVPSLAQPLNLSQNNLFKMKVWSTSATPILLKFEGPGQAVEKLVTMPAANQWVELSFDMSAGAAMTGLTKIIIFFDPGNDPGNNTYFFDDLVAVKNEVCYADFETPGLVFQGLDGVLTAPVANPGANQVNGSANCAQYVKSNAHAYSLILADNGASFDMTTNNLFKIDIYATAPTQILFKLEGSGGGFEKIKNIAVTGAWQTYYFDFSAQAANTGLSKVVMFFDPGVETSGDTYYFDNVCAVPNPCAGAIPNSDILDNFECDRNATYSVSWDSLYVVGNPNISGDNNSSKVGKIFDAAGPGTEYYPLIIDNQAPVDLSVKNQFSIQVWSSKPGLLLLKLEGGPNPPKEVPVQVTELNKWVTYTGDFSSQAGKGHLKWVIFFNAGVNGTAGDVYYIDNIKLSAPTAAPPLEDFQNGISLGWQGLDQNNGIHGTFAGPVDNPAAGGVNTTTKVGCYTKGAGTFSTLQGLTLTPFDLLVSPQMNIDILSPSGVGGTVLMQLVSLTQGNKEVEAEITTPGAWETLGFDFSAFSGITDFQEIRILFNPGIAASGQKWYFDNLRQTEITIDPCAGTIAIPTIADDFECQRNNEYGAGADKITVVNNPFLTPENGSLKVGQYKDPANEPWTALCLLYPNGIDLSLYNHLSIQVYGPAAVPILFKLEGGTSPAKEIFANLTTVNGWQKFDIDFSSEMTANHQRLCIFFNAGNENPETIYYIDNIKWGRAGYNGCIDDHQTVNSTIANFKYFANGALESQGYQFEVIDNPNASGINTSSKVGKFVKAGDGAPFAGMYADLDAVIDWKGVKTAKTKVHMDHIGNFTIKLEGSQTGAPAIENPVVNTEVNKWEELNYNFAAVADNAEYKRITVFFDLGIDATGTDVISYFDDIVIGDGACGSVGIFNPIPAEPMVVSPNPVADILFVENFHGVSRIDVFNLYGQRVASLDVTNEIRSEIMVTNFPAGLYMLSGFNQQGNLLGNAKFVKQ